MQSMNSIGQLQCSTVEKRHGFSRSLVMSRSDVKRCLWRRDSCSRVSALGPVLSQIWPVYLMTLRSFWWLFSDPFWKGAHVFLITDQQEKAGDACALSQTLFMLAFCCFWSAETRSHWWWLQCIFNLGQWWDNDFFLKVWIYSFV